MTANRVGGDESNYRYLGVYLLGVALGSAIRLVAFVVPSSLVRKLERWLIGTET